MIFTQGLWNKAIVQRVVHGRVDNTIQLDQTTLLVDLIFCTRALRDFDNCIYVLGGFSPADTSCHGCFDIIVVNFLFRTAILNKKPRLVDQALFYYLLPVSFLLVLFIFFGQGCGPYRRPSNVWIRPKTVPVITSVLSLTPLRISILS